MIIGLDTSTPVCRLYVHEGDSWQSHEWEAGRGLAKGLLGYLEEHLRALQAITGIIVFQGPGSYTGLRIGLTVMNTIASAQHIPIIGVTGEDWLSNGFARLSAGENDQLVMPEYGGEPHITTPRK
jgi:tRNA threonylcarbamoyladenosine biosynthesis protein TsaB